MRLSDLFNDLITVTETDARLIQGIQVHGLALDSRAVTKGDLFIALSGTKQHGLAHADKAIEQGACAIVFDPAGEGAKLAQNIKGLPIISVNQLSERLGFIAARFYGEPSRKLDVIGITGTNGKTSCSQFLGQLLDDCGIIGTLGWGEWGQLNTTVNTTPDALTVQKVVADFVALNKKAVAMEVSSHGLDQGRVNGVNFKAAVYTNISRDHLDYHGTMSAYLAAKLKLLQKPGLKFAVVNLDDTSSAEIMAATPSTVAVWGVSLQGKHLSSGETVNAENLTHTATGTTFDLRWREQTQMISLPLFGDFNAENILCVIAVMLALDYQLHDIAKKLATIQPVSGRLERCGTKADHLTVFVDYAHTPDALDRVLTSLRKHCQYSLWVVFGCGGNRDQGKRPQMGSIAERWADHVIITDDNPRFENNVEIAKEILAGCHDNKAIIIQDRKQAIQHAIRQALEHDYILIAGKGHENYQEINGIQYPFSDKQIAEEALSSRFGMQ